MTNLTGKQEEAVNFLPSGKNGAIIINKTKKSTQCGGDEGAGGDRNRKKLRICQLENIPGFGIMCAIMAAMFSSLGRLCIKLAEETNEFHPTELVVWR